MRVLCQSYDVNCNFNGNLLCKKLTNFAAKYLIVTITCKMQFPDTRGAEIIAFYFNWSYNLIGKPIAITHLANSQFLWQLNAITWQLLVAVTLSAICEKPGCWDCSNNYCNRLDGSWKIRTCAANCNGSNDFSHQAQILRTTYLFWLLLHL